MRHDAVVSPSGENHDDQDERSDVVQPCALAGDVEPIAESAWSGTSATVQRALRLIEDGVLDHANVDALCSRLGIGARQLRRLFQRHLGTTPIEVAQTRRAHFARKLIQTTGLPMAHISEAAGFGSVRRFNAVMNTIYGCSPTALRQRPNTTASGLKLQVAVRTPFAWQSLLDFLGRQALPSVERVVGDQYHRTARFRSAVGKLSVAYDATESVLRVTVSNSLSLHLLEVVSGVQRLFDVDGVSEEVASCLRADPLLETTVLQNPGLRVPGAFDHFETAVRALLRQNHTSEVASELEARLVQRHGALIEESENETMWAFPTPHALTRVRLEALGIPKRRAKAIQTLARVVNEGELRLDGSPSLDVALESLRNIPGMGACTADYIAMRVYREPDAFPITDRRLRTAVSDDDTPVAAHELEARAEAWRPWRAYAAMHLWGATCRSQEGAVPCLEESEEALPETTDQVA